MKKQAFNPYLPSWEYIPDGEPYVFGDRLYIYGSHDYFNCSFFCPGDYVSWSAPVNDLGNWRYEGVSFKRTDDPNNQENKGCLYAPDVTQGPDGIYYLFYVLDNQSVVAVARSENPQGPFRFYGHVHYEDGTLLGAKESDEPQFDPGVITIGDKVYLYTGFCGQTDASRHGAMVTVLKSDMLTIEKAPEFIVPGTMYAAGTAFEGHAFFEAPSIRERNGIFYFVYSSQVMHELCYATSTSPEGPFTYGGVIISNCDLGIGSYKDADKPSAYGANNHGSIVEINGDWYIFYHRHTNNTWYSRQGCAEKIKFEEDGSIKQVEMTSCGLNGGPLRDTKEYPSYIACNLFSESDDKEHPYVGQHRAVRVIQDGRDGDHETGYITAIHDGVTIGYKYFDLCNASGITLWVRGYGNGTFEVRTSIDGPVLTTIPVRFMTVWEKYSGTFTSSVTDPCSSLYLTYRGGGDVQLKSFLFIHE
ncbi:MAG: family 43 glycosylhydrolase [Clostridiales bacterium]|nr:family 43 glycosylhydrolase [Clostridiales bacterium]